MEKEGESCGPLIGPAPQPLSPRTVGTEEMCEGVCATVAVSGTVLPRIFNASGTYAWICPYFEFLDVGVPSNEIPYPSPQIILSK